MIHLTITAEAVTDLLTPGIMSPNKLIEGLPQGVELVNITYDAPSGMVAYFFDDGKIEITKANIKYVVQTS